jgi:hypothetical protein
MNLRRVVPALALLTVLLWLAGCTGAGPAATRGTGRPRCTPAAQDDQRPLFFLFCVESP